MKSNNALNYENIINDSLSLEKSYKISKEIFRMSWPNVLTLTIMALFDTFLYRYVGQLNSLSLSSFAIGFSILRLTSVTYIIGINSAIDTLISQYFGMKNYYKCSVILYIGFIVCNIFATFSFLTTMFSYNILKLFNVQDQIAQGASTFAKNGILYIYFTLNFDALKRMLNAQKIVNPQFYITIINGGFQIFHSYLFIKYYDYLGAVYSMSLTNFLNIIFTLLYILYTKKGCDIIKKVSLKDIYLMLFEYLSIGIPGGINFGLESIAFHVLNLFTAALSVVNSATNAIFMNLDIVMATIGLGIGNAICSLIGNSLGENNGELAKNYAFFGYSFVCILSFLVGLLTIIFRSILGYFYTSDELVLNNFKVNLLLVTVGIFFDNIQTGTTRIFAGMGFQKYASIIVIILYFPIMVPSAYFLKSKFELTGIWISLTLTFIIITIIESLIIYLTDFFILASKVTNKNIKTSNEENEELNKDKDKEMNLINN